MACIGALLVLALTSAGCPGPATATAASPAIGDSSSLRRIDHVESQLRLATSKALCPPEMRQLVRAIEDECRDKTTCDSETCLTIVRELDPKQRFLWITREQPRVVIYPIETPGQRMDFSEKRKGRLMRLLARPWLDTSQILLIAHSSSKERAALLQARLRARAVYDFLIHASFLPADHEPGPALHFPPERIKILEYDFPLYPPPKPERGVRSQPLGEMARQERSIIADRDMPNEQEAADIERGVWVFLVDC